MLREVLWNECERGQCVTRNLLPVSDTHRCDAKKTQPEEGKANTSQNHTSPLLVLQPQRTENGVVARQQSDDPSCLLQNNCSELNLSISFLKVLSSSTIWVCAGELNQQRKRFQPPVFRICSRLSLLSFLMSELRRRPMTSPSPSVPIIYNVLSDSPDNGTSPAIPATGTVSGIKAALWSPDPFWQPGHFLRGRHVDKINGRLHFCFYLHLKGKTPGRSCRDKHGQAFLFVRLLDIQHSVCTDILQKNTCYYLRGIVYMRRTSYHLS